MQYCLCYLIHCKYAIVIYFLFLIIIAVLHGCLTIVFLFLSTNMFQTNKPGCVMAFVKTLFKLYAAALLLKKKKLRLYNAASNLASLKIAQVGLHLHHRKQ